jgi:hypothetical protein
VVAEGVAGHEDALSLNGSDVVYGRIGPSFDAGDRSSLLIGR